MTYNPGDVVAGRLTVRKDWGDGTLWDERYDGTWNSDDIAPWIGAEELEALQECARVMRESHRGTAAWCSCRLQDCEELAALVRLEAAKEAQK